MRFIIALLLLCSSLIAGDRVPFRVTACRPVFVPNVCLPECKPVCVTIDGVDWDLDKIRAEYRTPWTWPNGTEASLRSHLKATHRIKDIDRIGFDDLKMIHAVIHERERVKTKLHSPPAMPTQSSPSRCPGGVCPSPGATRSTWTSRQRGFLFWR